MATAIPGGVILLLQQNTLQTLPASVSCRTTEPFPALPVSRRCRGDRRSRDVRWTVVDGARETVTLDSIPEAKTLRHPEEVDPLYRFACHLEWETNEEPGAGWDLIAAAQSSHEETRLHARALLSGSR